VKYQKAGSPSSDVRKLPERADDESTEQLLSRVLNDEPSSERTNMELVEDELIGEPEPQEESALSTNINYEVDSTQPLDRQRREVRAPKYLQKYVRLMPANKQKSD